MRIRHLTRNCVKYASENSRIQRRLIVHHVFSVHLLVTDTDKHHFEIYPENLNTNLYIFLIKKLYNLIQILATRTFISFETKFTIFHYHLFGHMKVRRGHNSAEVNLVYRLQGFLNLCTTLSTNYSYLSCKNSYIIVL